MTTNETKKEIINKINEDIINAFNYKACIAKLERLAG